MGYQPHNPGKTNQDSFILAPNLMQLSSLHLFGVCDGHGTNGHFVSAFIKKILPLEIESRFQKSDMKIVQSLSDAHLEVNH